MMVRRCIPVLLLLVFCVGLAAPVLAQDDEAIASGLKNPRRLFYTPDGTLYIAEGGTGGDIPIDTPEGPATFGPTGQVTVVSPDGEVSQLLNFLPSAGGSGVTTLSVSDDAIWVGFNMGPPNALVTGTVIALDPQSMRVTQFIDVFAHEVMNNFDGNEIDSNVNDLAVADDGTLFIVDAGCNCLYTWTEMDGLQLFHAWTDDPVPTSLAFDGEGGVYVSFLTPVPFLPETAVIEHWSGDGELLQTFEGFTMLVDVFVADDGTLYAVEFSGGLGDQGFTPESGRIVSVADDGTITPVMEGLNFPYDLAQSPDGQMVVSVNSAFSAPGSGMVIPVDN